MTRVYGRQPFYRVSSLLLLETMYISTAIMSRGILRFQARCMILTYSGHSRITP